MSKMLHPCKCFHFIMMRTLNSKFGTNKKQQELRSCYNSW